MRALVVLVVVILLFSCAGPREQVVLLAITDDGGQLTLRTAQREQILDAPYMTAQVRPDGHVQPGTTTPAAVHARWGSVLAALPEGGQRFTLRFDTGGTTLTADSAETIPVLLAEVQRRGAAEVLIEGHTDTAGALEDNDRLSLARAEAVHALLMEAGMTATFVRVVGRGERALAVPTADDTAEPGNRRVEVLVR